MEAQKKKPATDAADVDGMTNDECREALKQLLDATSQFSKIRFLIPKVGR
jgi:DNA-nicking Smr family endonuclease